MKKILFITLLSISFQSIQAQETATITPEIKALYEIADKAIQNKDYNKAIEVYHQAIKLQPNDIVLRRDLAYSYYLSGKYNEGLQVMKPLMQSQVVDAASYQVIAALENGNKNTKAALKTLDEGLKKFPNSGLLYNAKGNHQLTHEKKNTIPLATFVQGIKADPYYIGNYIQASKILSENNEPIWSMLYAEIAINLDPSSNKSIEAKQTLYNTIKKVFINDPNATKKFKSNAQNPSYLFSEAVKSILNNHYIAIADEMNIENIIMLRTRFLTEWITKHPVDEHSLFAFYQKLITSGNFDAYNQVILGAAIDSKGYSEWMKNNATALNNLSKFMEKNAYHPNINDHQYFLQ